MANYATNLFFATTKNEQDLNKIEVFLNDNFGDCFLECADDALEGEFSSRWAYPKELIDELVASLETKDSIYIRVLTYEMGCEYVSFRIFSQGKWNIKL